MSIGPRIKWIKDNSKKLKFIIIILTLAIIINFLITYLFKSYSLISNLIMISSIFLIMSSFLDLKKFFNNKTNELPRVISHISFGFLILFIGLNHNFTLEKDFNLKIGDKKEFDNYSLEFKNLSLKEKKNYKAIIGEFKIRNSQKEFEKSMYPEIRIYEKPSTLTYEASIRTMLLKDYYITMSNIDRSEYYNIKFQKKPFMVWIWISVIFISMGGFIRLFKNAKNY